jgi:hypothetical protein
MWIVVFVVYGTFRTIPTVESYGAGVFVLARTLIAVKLLTSTSTSTLTKKKAFLLFDTGLLAVVRIAKK